MQLTRHTDFSLRVLIFLSLQEKDTLVTIDDIASHFNIARNHLTKIVHRLGRYGYVKTVRGKNGGICLASSPDKINLGKIVKDTEANTEVVNCQEPVCPLNSYCTLKRVLNEAQQAFFSTLEQYTLADISKQPQKIKTLLNWTG